MEFNLICFIQGELARTAIFVAFRRHGSYRCIIVFRCKFREMMVPHKLYENTLLSIKYFHLQIFTFLSNFTDTISIVEFHYDANETSKSSKHNKRNAKVLARRCIYRSIYHHTNKLDLNIFASFIITLTRLRGFATTKIKCRTW